MAHATETPAPTIGTTAVSMRGIEKAFGTNRVLEGVDFEVLAGEVHTLAGLLRTRDGSVLVYAFLINNPKNQFAARVWLDRVTAALSTCGCR